ncbi:collagen alpha-5 chain [Cladorrhinum samala]|uniref:Collagen alpha-5 chain n=1 Tax=Cladorrhinum samala TaxID=585594 RepID=A0AAV9HJV4_9PEZI|nr:collagen alpha-5 chain [Cladorrhinum samala]
MQRPGSRRSVFSSFKDKLRGSRSPSPSPNKMGCGQSSFSSNNPFAGINTGAPPPPYSEQPRNDKNPAINIHGADPARAPSPTPSNSSAMSNPSITSPDDPYAFLALFDTIFLIDDSSSMTHENRWPEVRDVLRSIAPVCTSHDADGIDIYFLNHKNTSSTGEGGGYLGIKSAKQVEDIFDNKVKRPNGWTPTGTRINHILQPYLRRWKTAADRTGNPEDCGVKPINMIVITDGSPTDDPEAVIINIAKKLDSYQAPPHQVGIQFFQVGSDKEATLALQELDDGLATQGGGCRDIVDTVTFDSRSLGSKVLSAEAVLKTVLGAVVRRLDRRTTVRPSNRFT